MSEQPGTEHAPIMRSEHPNPGPPSHTPAVHNLGHDRRRAAARVVTIAPVYETAVGSFGAAGQQVELLRVDETDAPVRLEAIGCFCDIPASSTLGVLTLSLVPIMPPPATAPNAGAVVIATAAVNTAGAQTALQSNLLTWLSAGCGRLILPGFRLVLSLGGTNVYTGGAMRVSALLYGAQGEALR